MDPVSFYGTRRKRVVLPPINREQSDGDDSNDSVPEIFDDNSDDDPDYMPDVPSTSRNTRILVVEETDTESDSEDNRQYLLFYYMRLMVGMDQSTTLGY